MLWGGHAMKPRIKAACVVAFLVLTLVAYSVVPAQQAPQEPAQPATAAAPQAQQAPSKPPCLGKFDSYEEAEEFLRTAQIVNSKGVPVGVTLPREMTLEKDGRQELAVFKTIDERKSGVTQLRTGPEVDFKDSWKFEIAAYELNRMLNLNMIPPVVERKHGTQKGSLQLWIDGCMTETERSTKKIQPPGPMGWRQQMFKVRVFDNLIYNIDRNLGNLLITPDWQLIMIDHSRSFKSLDALKSPKDLTFFSASLMKSLEALNKDDLEAKCGDYLTGFEISTLLKRRDRILAMYRKVADTPGAVYP
jgi:hypothetical protein